MLRLEFRVVHAMLVVSDVVGAFACLLATCRVSPESLADGRQPAGIQFLVPLLGPLAGSFRMITTCPGACSKRLRGAFPPDSCGKLGAVSVGVGRRGTFDCGPGTHPALLA